MPFATVEPETIPVGPSQRRVTHALHVEHAIAKVAADHGSVALLITCPDTMIVRVRERWNEIRAAEIERSADSRGSD